jgi:hypothetical protein
LIALLYGALLLVAEQQRALAWRHVALHEESLKRLAIARMVFPFDYRFREGAAVFYARIRWKGSKPAAIKAMREAIQADPYSMGMHRNLAGMLYEAGDKEGMAVEIEFLKRFMPHVDPAIVVNANPDTN